LIREAFELPAGAINFYPVFLKLQGKKCVIVGAGEVAERKALRLLECGAAVSVVGREPTPALRKLAREGRLEYVPADYDETLIKGAYLVISATDDRAVNEAVRDAASREEVPINVVDDPRLCDFILPSIVQRGALQIAISTGGASPALARKIRLEMEKEFGEEYALLLDILGELRKRILDKGRPSPENKKVFEAVVNSDALDLLRKKKWDEARSVIRKLTGEDIDLERSLSLSK
jgi:precorrin-2 dehydrogenase / sirohydrochlorin ferrochelatase